MNLEHDSAIPQPQPGLDLLLKQASLKNKLRQEASVASKFELKACNVRPVLGLGLSNCLFLRRRW